MSQFGNSITAKKPKPIAPDCVKLTGLHEDLGPFVVDPLGDAFTTILILS
jgi:hypothetical protein